MKIKYYSIRNNGIFLVLLLIQAPAVSAQTKQLFTNYSYGKTPQYYQQRGADRQDVSGSAWDGKRTLLAYDPRILS